MAIQTPSATGPDAFAEYPRGAIITSTCDRRGGAFGAGPQSPALANNEQPLLNPPATDVGNNPQFWSSFNIAPKRVQAGGWARQINTGMFPISKDMTGVSRSH